MYLKINNTNKPLASFSQVTNKIAFVFSEDIGSEDFADVSKIGLYSDDDMYLAEYSFKDFDVSINKNALYLIDKNFIEDVEATKADMIQRSKELLAEWLSRNPMLYTDGNYYSVTEEKQALLNSNLASYERAKAAGIDYPLKWNSTGAECTEWEYSELLALSLSIAAYVAPKVAMQQAIELEIKAVETMEQLDKVVIIYEG